MLDKEKVELLKKSTAGLKSYRVIAVIPAFNEAHSIGKVLERVGKHVSEIIVVDDGSTDGTGDIASSMGVTVLRNARNMGKGFALKRGFLECLRKAPHVVITLDADGQHDPNDIPNLLLPINEKRADIVIGSRYVKGSRMDAPLVRKIGLATINSLNKHLLSSSVIDSQSGFRAYSKRTFNLLVSSAGYGAEVEQLNELHAHGFKVAEVPVSIQYKDLVKTSKRNFILHGVSIASTILRIAIETRPLLYFGVAGLSLIVSFALASYFTIYYFNTTGYFSIPLALIAIGLGVIGSMFLLVSFVFYVLKRIKEREDAIATILLELLRQEKATISGSSDD